MSDIYRVFCENKWHRGPEGINFGIDPEAGVAVAEVDRETAVQLLDRDDDAYRCPVLEQEIEDTSDEKDEAVEDAADAEEGGDEESDTDAPADLEDIDGIGPARAEKLRVLGLETPHDLADADAADVADAFDKVDAETVADWQAQV